MGQSNWHSFSTHSPLISFALVPTMHALLAPLHTPTFEALAQAPVGDEGWPSGSCTHAGDMLSRKHSVMCFDSGCRNGKRTGFEQAGRACRACRAGRAGKQPPHMVRGQPTCREGTHRKPWMRKNLPHSQPPLRVRHKDLPDEVLSCASTNEK